ncbi:MAG TPA: hypothetical protein VG099_14215 [Gemmataceae bacterium]|jgi:hypothetical protein|nr:hypothetical protein [Gemmataceae bacterium]
MRLTYALLFGVVLFAAARSSAFQAGDKLKSGPQAGESIPGPFHFVNINGAYAGDPHCLVCEYGLKPVAAVFARTLPESGKPLADLLQKLDETIGKNQASEFRGFAAILSPDFAADDMRKELVQKLEGAAKDLKQLIVCVGADSPDKYNINKDAEVTVVLYHNHKVVANFAFEKDKLGDKDVATIVAAFQKMALKR